MGAFGPESVAAALFTYRPAGARNLALLLRADRQRETLSSYLSMGVRRILYALCGEGADFPTYYDFARNIRAGGPQARKDTRNTTEILTDLIKGLEGGNK